MQGPALGVLPSCPNQYNSPPAPASQPVYLPGCRLASETHEIARRKVEQMDKLRAAFGLGAEAKEGEAFDQELQEQRRQERIAEREAKEKARV